jgi:TPR repeat protein
LLALGYADGAASSTRRELGINKPGQHAYFVRMRSIFPIVLFAMFLAAASAGSAPSWAQSVLDGLSFEKKLTLAKAGDEEAQIAVAEAYLAGTEAKASRIEAAKWFRAAAQQGNPEGEFRLARLLHEGGDGVKKSPELAVPLYQSAADQSAEIALKWYAKAAEQGFATAQNNLGMLHLNGKGTARDFQQAYRWFEKAAAQGDGWGLNNQAGMLEMGWGVPQDRQGALALYGRAAEAGIAVARDNQARLAAQLDGNKAATPAD